MNFLLRLWDRLAWWAAKALQHGPADERITISLILAHADCEIGEVAITSNVPQLTTLQAMMISYDVLRQRPCPQANEEFLPTLVPWRDGITIRLSTVECAGLAMAPA